jgi:membrane associated rhomboid family serine protease
MSESDSHGPLTDVGRYARLADARERGLVVSAKELPHWIERDGDEWILRVEERSRELVLHELAAFDAEERERPAPAPARLFRKINTASLYVAGWAMGMWFLAQNLGGERWMNRGEAASNAILARGEWWRTVTALTLHGDLAHLAANLATGLLFAAFVIPHLGAGLAWLAIVLTGVLGNALNAWGYRGEPHASIGASTAVFGALGLLVGAEFVVRLAGPDTRSRWQLVLPIGAGLALLAFLGVGEERSNVDFMAHLWGFAVGIPMGALAAWLRIGERAPIAVQRAGGVLALVAPAVAWWMAWR